MKKLIRGYSKEGFSLPEVTISVGIVAVVILPTLALLTSGARLQQVTVDRDMATVIANSIINSFETVREPGQLAVILAAQSRTATIPVPSLSDSNTAFFLANADGSLISEIGAAEFGQAISTPPEALYAVKAQLTRVQLPETNTIEIIEVEIQVQSPANAAESNRDVISFTSLSRVP